MDNQHLPPDEAMTEDQDMNEEGEYDDDEYYEGGDGLFDDKDEDEDEDAEAVAKRLGDALWADISKAYAQRASEPAQANNSNGALPSPSEHNDDEQNLVDAIQTVLRLASTHATLNNVLSCTIIPGTDSEHQSLLGILTGTAETRKISPELADTLSNLVQSIADGELFATTEQTHEAE